MTLFDVNAYHDAFQSDPDSGIFLHGQEYISPYMMMEHAGAIVQGVPTENGPAACFIAP
jgi:hypothetical protein